MTAILRKSRPVCLAAILLSLQILGGGLRYLAVRWGGPWLFPPTEQLRQVVLSVGSYYAMLLAAVVPALVPAAAIMALSPFARPYRVLAGTVGSWWLFPHLVWWAVKPPHWELVSRHAPAVALICEVVCAFALVGLSILTLHLLYRVGRHSAAPGFHG